MVGLIGLNLAEVPPATPSSHSSTSSLKKSQVGKQSAKRQFIRGEIVIDPVPIMDMEVIDDLVEDLYEHIKKHNLPPVTARDVYPQSRQELWDNIRPIEFTEATYEEEFLVMGSVPRDNYYLRPRLQPRDNNVTMPAKYIVLIGGFDTYSSSDRITDFYQEERRLDAYHSRINIEGVTGSANDMWFDHPHILKKWLRSAVIRYTNANNPTINYEDNAFQVELITSLFNDKIHVSQYRVTWVVSIIQFFREFIDIDSMLDPSMGWGDRLIGAMKAGVNYYGCDPNASLHPGYERMIKDFAPDDRTYTHIQSGFEDVVIDVQFDFILTSPPYGDIEIYSNDSNQSIEKYDGNWMVGFYELYLTKSWNALREGGIMVLQIGDNRNFKMVDHTIKFFKEISDCIPWGQFLTYSERGKYGNLHLVFMRSIREAHT